MLKTGAIKKLLIHLPVWILLLQMVNLSVDLSGLQLNPRMTTLSQSANIHEIETLYELIADEFADHSLPGTENEGIDKDLHFFDITCQRLPDTDLIPSPGSPDRGVLNEERFKSYYPTLLSPPPDQA